MKKESDALLALVARQTHRIAQKASLTMMVAVGLISSQIRDFQYIAIPDGLILISILGVVVYFLANRFLQPVLRKRNDWHEEAYWPAIDLEVKN